MQIGSLPTTKECYSRTGVGLWVVLRETIKKSEVDWVYDENI